VAATAIPSTISVRVVAVRAATSEAAHVTAAPISSQTYACPGRERRSVESPTAIVDRSATSIITTPTSVSTPAIGRRRRREGT
jgi:hypothetical protein